MNTINDTFSFSRFGMVLRRDLIENRGRYLGTFFILFIAFLVFQLHDIKDIIEMSLIRTYEQGDYMASLATDCKPLFYGLLSLSLMCAAADMTSVPMGSKTRATNYMMMPATNLEKFLSRVFINVVLVIIMAYGALFLADLVRMLFVPFYEVKEFYGLTLPRVFVGGSEPFIDLYKDASREWSTIEGIRTVVGFKPTKGFTAVSLLSAFVLFFHSLFVLGGCIWRKGAVVKTLAVGIAVIIIGSWLIEKYDLHTFFTEAWPYFFYNSKWADTLTYLFFIVPIFNWWLSFRLFSRKQVVARTHLFAGKHPHHLFNKAHS